MANDSFRRAVDSRLSSVEMSHELKARIRGRVAQDEVQRQGKTRQPITFKRAMAAALAAVMTFAFGFTVIAAVVPSFERLLQTIGDVGGLLQPINLVSENGGVRMEVVAAINDGESAYVYLNMQDTEGKGLITETTQLQDVAFGDDSFVRAEQIAFDGETGTATYRLQWNDAFADISGQRITLHVEGLLLNQRWEHDVDTGYTLADILALSPAPQATYSNEYGSWGMSYGSDNSLAMQIEAMYDDGSMPLLERGNLAQPLANVPWLPITSAGVVDGMLHIQVENEDFISRFNLANLYLGYPGDENDSLFSANSAHNVLDTTGWHDHYEFEEFVMEIPQGVEPEDVVIMAGGLIVDGYYDAGWEVTFTFEEYVELLEWHCSIDLGGWQIKRLELSPIGITAFGRGEMGENDAWLDMQAVLYDGTVVESDSSSVSSRYTGEIVSKIGFKGLIDPNDVEKIIINGQEFSVSAAHIYAEHLEDHIYVETENAA